MAEGTAVTTADASIAMLPDDLRRWPPLARYLEVELRLTGIDNAAAVVRRAWYNATASGVERGERAWRVPPKVVQR